MALELYYYQDKVLNFGDDLNAELWPRVLPRSVLEADDLLLVGVGSILTEDRAGSQRNRGKRIVVLGTGTSYGVPPRDMDGWTVKAVRGPLTARVIGREDAAVTDAAILLAGSGLIPTGKPRDVVFIPHHRSLLRSDWKKVAELAQVRFLSPASPLDVVLQAIANARLVVTEAMHGAIFADTLRVPWVPVRLSPAFDQFKWLDWCLSMELPLSVTPLPPSCATEADRHADLCRKYPNLRAVGRELTGAEDRQALVRHLEAMYRPGEVGGPPPLTTRIARRPLRLFDSVFAAKAARTLQDAARATSYLSEDKVFKNRLDRMQSLAASLSELV